MLWLKKISCYPCKKMSCYPCKKISCYSCKKISCYPCKKMSCYPWKKISCYPCRKMSCYPCKKMSCYPCKKMSLLMVFLQLTCYWYHLHSNWNNCEKKIETVMINNSTNINEMNNRFLPQIIKYKKDYNIWCWKSRSWLGTGTKMWQG